MKKRDINFVETPAERVAQFIIDWHRQWGEESAAIDFDAKESGQSRGKVDFARWGNRVRIIEERHFLPSTSSGTAYSFGSEAEHDPQTELITNAEVEGETATVETSKTSRVGTTEYRVYELVKADDAGWLMTAILTLFDPPQSTLIPQEEHQSIFEKSSVDADLMPLDDNLNPDEQLLFTDGRTVTIDESRTDTTSVNTLGYLHIYSGIVGINDYGYDAHRFEPMERRIPPGKYLAETVSAFDSIAAVRVLFNQNNKAQSWRMAKTANGDGSFGVDAGNLAIFDVESYANISALQKERIYTKWIYGGTAMLFSMTRENDGLVVSSGYGDGKKPAPLTRLAFLIYLESY